jgi:hypothetical protein
MLAALLLPATASGWAAGGHLDRSFSRDGKASTDFAGPACSARPRACDDRAAGLAMAGGGRVIAAGSAGGSHADFALAEYRPDGSLDRDFAGNGRLRSDLGGDDHAHDVAIDSQRRIVVAGFGGPPDGCRRCRDRPLSARRRTR